MYIEFNNNPLARRVDDCAVRAVSKALDTTWEAAYVMLTLNGINMGDIMSGNSVIGATLRKNGFRRANIPNTCPDCYTVRQFAEDNPTGTYVLGTDGHVVCVDGSSYRDGRSYADDRSYGDGRSYARGRRRDSMGRYSRGYSMANEDMMDELRELMEKAPDEMTKREFKKFIDKIETM